MSDAIKKLIYRCVRSQDTPFWEAIRPNCTYGLIPEGILHEGKRCVECDNYKPGERLFTNPQLYTE